MTVREFTSRMWYEQKLIVVKWKKFDLAMKSNNALETAKETAEYIGTSYELRSVTYEKINNMSVDSYGAIDDTVIIEVH